MSLPRRGLKMILGSLHRRRPRGRTILRVDHLEGRCLLANLASVTDYSLPTASASPTAIVAGSDGNLWSLENAANKIAMTNPSTGATTEFPVPTAGAGFFGITSGPDGNIWFTERSTNRIGTINVTTHAVSEFTISNTFNGGNGPMGIATGADGNLWFAYWPNHAIASINPATHAISQYPLPSSYGNPPMWVTSGPDGNIWFTRSAFPNLDRFNLTTHAFTDFTAPGTSAGYAVVTHLAPGPDGNVWFADANGNAVGFINPSSGVMSEYPASAGPGSIVSGPDGNLWFAETGVNQLGRVNPATGAIVEYPIVGGLNQVASGPDGNIWFSSPGSNAIGVGRLATTQWVVTQQPPSSVTAGIPFSVTVQAEDSSGNPIAFNGSVSVALGGNGSSGAVLGGTLTTTAVNGLATFSGLTLTKAASGYTLAVSGDGVGWGLSSPFAVTPAAATHLAILQQPPSSVGVNKAFGLQAAIEDQYGNIVTSASNTVSVAFAYNPYGATLGGTLTATAVNGVVTFSNLTINKKGTGYTLQLSSAGLVGVMTSAITT
jgi:streptogramin lyase